MDAQQLTASLNGRWHRSYGTACCPAHDDRTPSLKISDGDTAILLKCFTGCDTLDVIDALRRIGLWPDSGATGAVLPGYSPNVRKYRLTCDANLSNRARELWRRGQPAAGTPVATYLESRAISADIPWAIRYLPNAEHKQTGSRRPCMLAALTRWPSDGVVAVHRTFLLPDGTGKAAVPGPKLALGPMAGAAVMLAKATETLGLAEGIETALSAMQMYGAPVWAACGSNLAGVVIPDSVKKVIIYADNGLPGEQAAEKAAALFHAQGRSVILSRPVDGYGDFNDCLQAQAAGRGS